MTHELARVARVTREQTESALTAIGDAANLTARIDELDGQSVAAMKSLLARISESRLADYLASSPLTDQIAAQVSSHTNTFQFLDGFLSESSVGIELADDLAKSRLADRLVTSSLAIRLASTSSQHLRTRLGQHVFADVLVTHGGGMRLLRDPDLGRSLLVTSRLTKTLLSDPEQRARLERTLRSDAVLADRIAASAVAKELLGHPAGPSAAAWALAAAAIIGAAAAAAVLTTLVAVQVAVVEHEPTLAPPRSTAGNFPAAIQRAEELEARLTSAVSQLAASSEEFVSHVALQLGQHRESAKHEIELLKRTFDGLEAQLGSEIRKASQRGSVEREQLARRTFLRIGRDVAVASVGATIGDVSGLKIARSLETVDRAQIDELASNVQSLERSNEHLAQRVDALQREYKQALPDLLRDVFEAGRACAEEARIGITG